LIGNQTTKLMKNLTLFILLVLNLELVAQTTIVPDPIFEQELINLGLDNVLDGTVLTNNIDTLTYLNLYNLGLNDLSGLEDFTALETLLCLWNNLITLDVTQNLNLKELVCSNNQLVQLDVSNNVLLEELSCGYNQITSLDISVNTLLDTLACENNLLSSLDVSTNLNLVLLYCMYNSIENLDLSNNQNLIILWCNNNQITSLDVSTNPVLADVICEQNNLSCLNLKNGNNTNMWLGSVNSFGNPNLTCIQVDDSLWAASTWALVLPAITFSENCNYSCTVGIDELNQPTFNIYPNPVTEQLYIVSDYKYTNAQIIDVTGKQIKAFVKVPSVISVVDLPKGIYFLKLDTEHGPVTKKFTKQ
jgi:Secretion system C-terminal sorting domain